MIGYVENTKEFTEKLPEERGELSKALRYKVSV